MIVPLFCFLFRLEEPLNYINNNIVAHKIYL